MNVAQPEYQSTDPREAAWEQFNELRKRLSGDAVLVPFADGQPDWVVACREMPERVAHWSDIAIADIPRLGILTDGFHRWIETADDISIVALWRGGQPELVQIDGPASEAAMDLVQDAITGIVDLDEAQAAREDRDIAKLEDLRAEHGGTIGRTGGGEPCLHDATPRGRSGSFRIGLDGEPRFYAKPDDVRERLEELRKRYGGEIRDGADGRPCLFGADFDGRLGQFWISPGGSERFVTAPAAANDNNPPPKKPLLIASGDFVRDFVPPDYLIDGIVQSGFLYSLTGQTGAGKTAVALLLAACTSEGAPFAGREVKPGRVFYFAGENPDDVTMRWIGLCHTMGLRPDDLDVHFVRGVFDLVQFLDHIRAEAQRLGGVGLIIVDTTAAYFLGTDENSNVEMGAYARLLRELAQLPWRPAVLAASHPVKNAAADNLLPRGGGAFLNELDGNLTLAKRGECSALHWQGKHRGPDFAPLVFDMKQVTAPGLVDSRGRDIPTVLAVPVGEEEVAQRAAATNMDDELMLLAIRADGNRSLRDLAVFLDWMKDGEPDRRRAQASTDRLKKLQAVTYELSTWRLTSKGERAATEAAQRHHSREAQAQQVAGFVQRNRGRRTRRRTSFHGNGAPSVQDGEND